MKKIIPLVASLLFLSACGNSLGLDQEQLQEATQTNAMDIRKMNTNGYEEEDVEIVRVCPAVKSNEASFDEGDGYDSYIVYWQTSDGELQYDHRMDINGESNYEVGGSTSLYNESTETECVEY